MASRGWVSSASASGSSLPHGPGILTRRALPGLFLCAGLAGFPVGGAFVATPAARAAAWQAPDTTAAPPDSIEAPPGGVTAPPGGTVAPADTSAAPPDTARALPPSQPLLPSEVGLKPEQSDSLRIRQAAGIPQRSPSPSGVMGPPAPGGPGAAEALPAERRGVLGLHPFVIVLGLVAAHIVLIRLVTKE